MKLLAFKQLIKEEVTSILKEESYKTILIDKIKNSKLSEEEKSKLIADLEDANNIPKVAAKLEAATGSVKESLSNEERIEKAAFDDGWDTGYKVGYQVGYQDAKDGHPPGITEVKEVNSYLKALKSDLAKLKGQDPNGYSDPKEYKALVREIEKMIKDFESKKQVKEEEEPSDKDIKNDSISINATKLAETAKELKSTLNLYKKAEGEEKQKHLKKLKELTNIKKELERAL